jgi:FAD/FMN-containing dehydrogenase
VDSVTRDILKVLGESKVLFGSDLSNRYNHIWRMNEGLKAKLFCLPSCTEDVAEIVKICNQNNQNIVVFGGLTNLVGSTVTEVDDVVVSMEKMDNIEEVDTQSRTITCQAGVIIANLQNAAESADLLFPLNFGAVGSAQIGGAISTNAGGLKVIKYGMTRHLVLGLEVVMPDGTIVNSLKKIVKDNSGYDIKQLFIGAEGTLGIVTRAVLKLVEKPTSRISALVGIEVYSSVVELLKLMDEGLAGNLSSFELMWPDMFDAMTGETSSVERPIESKHNYYVLIEALGSNQIVDAEVFENLLGVALENGLIQDGAMASSEADLNWFWKIREDVKVLKDLSPNDQHFDISLPIPHIGTVISNTYTSIMALPEVVTCFAFGHVADGNIHFIIGKSNQSSDLIDKINDIIYPQLKEIGGSISAEHGIGLDKKAYLHHSRNEEELAMFKTLKTTLDPHNIMNRGKLI